MSKDNKDLLIIAGSGVFAAVLFLGFVFWLC